MAGFYGIKSLPQSSDSDSDESSGSRSSSRGLRSNRSGSSSTGSGSRSTGTNSRSNSSARNQRTPTRSRSGSQLPGPSLSGSGAGSRGRQAASRSDDSSDNESISSHTSDTPQRVNARRAARQRRLAEGGLNVGERATKGRLRNPSKYTDKSMHTNLDRSAAVGGARRRMAEGMPREVQAICTNRLGKVRMCKRLITPMNFRRLYLRLDFKIPRNLLMALTLDVSDNRLRTLNADSVTTYFYNAARYLRTSISSADDELLNSDLAVRWMMNAIQILEGLHLCIGELTMTEAIDVKYSRDLDVQPGTLGAMLRRTVPHEGNHTRAEALQSLRNLADIVKPTDIRIWGIDDTLGDDPHITRYTNNVFLGEARANEIRVYPLAEKKSYMQQVVFED